MTDLYQRVLEGLEAAPHQWGKCVELLATLQLQADPTLAPMLSDVALQLTAPGGTVTVQTLPIATWKIRPFVTLHDGNTVLSFRSSGTTAFDRSQVDLDLYGRNLYHASLWQGFRKVFDYKDEHIIALMPPPTICPDSSLSEMLNTLGAEFVCGEGWPQRLLHILKSQRHPIIVFGTAFAWVHYVDAVNGAGVRLPEGSRVIETGGYKGKSRELPKAELYSILASLLGLETDAIWSEYGMCELSSQFYSRGIGGLLQPSPSIRSIAINPGTGLAEAPGVDGILVHVDLANWCSYVAVETQDWGNVSSDGYVTLKGRARTAPPKGCSLDTDTP